MQAEDALKLQREKGNKPCHHPEIDREYYLGSQTGDWVCTSCGSVVDKSKWNKTKRS